MECPSCKNGHFVTQMEIDTDCCWYCGGKIKKERAMEPKPRNCNENCPGNMDTGKIADESSAFRNLLEMSDKIAREELGDYYVMSASRMHNMLDCLESGAKQIQQLTAENERLQERDGNAHIVLLCPTPDDPFRRQTLAAIDFGVSDNVYVVEIPKDL